MKTKFKYWLEDMIEASRDFFWSAVVMLIVILIFCGVVFLAVRIAKFAWGL